MINLSFHKNDKENNENNIEYCKINDINNAEKDIYDFCLTHNYDYSVVKKLRDKFSEKMNKIGKNILKTEYSNNSTDYTRKNSSRNKKNTLFPFQILNKIKKENQHYINNNSYKNKYRRYSYRSNDENYNIYNNYRNSFKLKTEKNKKNNYKSFEKTSKKDNNYNKKDIEEAYKKASERYKKIIKKIKSSSLYKNSINKYNNNINKINDKSLKKNKNINYGDKLYKNGIEFKNLVYEKVMNKYKNKNNNNNDDNFTFSPKINKISKEALEYRKNHNLQYNNNYVINNYKDYIDNKIKLKEIEKENEIKLFEKENNTFKPKINKKSKNIHIDNIYNKLYNDRLIISNNIKELDKKNYNFSYKPKVNKNYHIKNKENSIFIKYAYLLNNNNNYKNNKNVKNNNKKNKKD